MQSYFIHFFNGVVCIYDCFILIFLNNFIDLFQTRNIYQLSYLALFSTNIH